MIIKQLDGKYKVQTNIQDGTEYCGPYDTLAEAVKHDKQAAEFFNGVKSEEYQIELFEVEEVIERKHVLKPLPVKKRTPPINFTLQTVSTKELLAELQIRCQYP